MMTLPQRLPTVSLRTDYGTRSYVRSAEESRENALVRFATIQWFALIYLQKFAIVSGPVAIGVPMLTLCIGTAHMFLIGQMRTSGSGLATYLLFVGLAGLSQWPSLATASMPSFAFVAVLYALMTLRVDVSRSLYERIQRRVLDLMLLPAAIALLQFVWQKSLNVSNPLSMDALVPGWLLMPGFVYEAPQIWNEPFVRPNGFFFLETSFASAFLATATILEAATDCRRSRMVLYLAGTLATLGGTGIMMLVLSWPFLWSRWKQRHQPGPALVTGFWLFLIGLVAVGLDSYVSARLDEFKHAGSSGTGRLLLPAQYLLSMFESGNYLFFGEGAGSTMGGQSGSAWPVVKLTKEYGIISTLAFVAHFSANSKHAHNKVVLAVWGVAFFFTGGYLLSPVFVEPILLGCSLFSIGPDQSARHDTAAQR